VAVHGSTRSSVGFTKDSQSFAEMLQRVMASKEVALPGGEPAALPRLDMPEEGHMRAPAAPSAPESLAPSGEGGNEPSNELHEDGRADSFSLFGVDPVAALVGSFGTGPAAASAPTDARAWVAHEPLVREIVRAIAWGGDRRRGTARIELGGSRLGGGTVVVHAEGTVIRLELEGPPDVDTTELRARVVARLEARGFTVQD